MVRDVDALRRPPDRTSGGAGLRGDENARPCAPAAPRPPLRAIQPPASGAPRCPLPTARKGLGVRASKGTAVRSSLALRKPGFKLPFKSGLTTAGTSSAEEPRYKIWDAISFWEENHSSGKNAPLALQQYGSHAPAMIENSDDERLTRYSDDTLKLQLELDILITIFAAKIKAHAEFEKTTGFDDELKAANFHILEASRQKEAKKSELNKEKSIIETLEKDEVYREASHSSTEQEKDRVSREAEIETAEMIILLDQQLDASKKSLDKLQLEKNELSDRLVEVMKQNEENLIELKSYVAERNICFESLQNEFSKLSDEKECCEAQVLIFKKKLEMVQSLTAESEAIAIEAQQIAEERKAYAEEKDKQVKLLERSNEDLEITICELENKVEITKEEAKQQRMQREELELKLQNIRQQTLDVPSSRNASCSLEDEMVDFVGSTRHSEDVKNELLDAQEVSENGPGVLGFVQEGPASCMINRKQYMGMRSPFGELMQGAKASDGEHCADACSHSSHEDYWQEISEFEQRGLDERLEQYSTYGQTGICGAGVGSDQSQFESRSGEQLSPPAVEAAVEIVEESELPPLALVRSHDPVNYMKAPSGELKKLRNRNHYEGQRTATDRWFWSIEQQDLYNSIYSRAKLACMKWIDWNHIANIQEFAGVRKRCAHLGLEKIMSYCCHWNSELIRQFYSTVHISADKTSMTWMSDGRKITANKRAWEERFGIRSGIHTEIHSQLFLNDDNKRILYTAAEYTLGHISADLLWQV